MENIKVVIIMGSKSDLAVMEEAAKVLKDFGFLNEMKVLSAHRTPEETAQYAQGLKGRGVQAVICGAGMSAALSGVVAAHTTLPVIGVPLEASSLDGIDALLSTVMMPPGVPVGAVAIGIPGAKNAAYLALRIMGVTDKDIEGKLEDFRKEQARKILDIKL